MCLFAYVRVCVCVVVSRRVGVCCSSVYVCVCFFLCLFSGLFVCVCLCVLASLFVCACLCDGLFVCVRVFMCMFVCLCALACLFVYAVIELPAC